MAIQDVWFANLKTLVENEGGGRRGIRAVADLSGLSEEYVYQLVEKKPNNKGIPREIGKEAAGKIARAFAQGREINWFDQDHDTAPKQSKQNSSQALVNQAQSAINRGATISQTLAQLNALLAGFDTGTRETIANLTQESICKPDKAEANIAAIEVLVRFATGKIETAQALGPVKTRVNSGCCPSAFAE